MCRIFLWKFIHEVKRIQVYSKMPHATWKVLQKTQNARGAREIAFAAIFISQFICWMLHWKKKQTTLPSSHGVLLQERTKAVNMLQQYVSIAFTVCIGQRSLNAGVRNAWLQMMSTVWLAYIATFVSRIPGFVITLTSPCSLDPREPHFYRVKLGFTGVYIISLLSAFLLHFNGFFY